MATRNKSRSILHMVAAAGVAVGTGLAGTAVHAAATGSGVANPNALPTATARPGIHMAACQPCKPACGACAPSPCGACAPNPCAPKK